MRCPKCEDYMYNKSIRGVRLDFCPSCRGGWFDRSELAAALKTKHDLHFTARGLTGARSSFDCPNCSGRLYGKPYATDAGIEVDQCNECSGIFVDKGEITRIKEFNAALQKRLSDSKVKRLQKKNKRREKLSKLYKHDHPVAKETALTRKEFLSKVYSLLGLSLLITATTAFIGTLFPIKSEGLLLGVVVAYFVFFGATLYLRHKKVPALILLFIFAGVTGFMLSFSLSLYIAAGLMHLIWISVAMTAVLFIGLTVYVLVTRRDFSAWRGFLHTSLWILIGGSILYLFFPYQLLSIVTAAGGILIFCGYILMDTSNILLKFNTEEYVLATLELYLDIINLFLDILRLLAESQDD